MLYEQEPDYRQPFWGFPHSSIDIVTTTALVSSLYDSVITSSVSRMASAVSPTCNDNNDDNNNNTNKLMTIFVFLLAGILLLLIAMYVLLLRKYNAKGYKNISVEGEDGVTDLTRNVPFLTEQEQQKHEHGNVV